MKKLLLFLLTFSLVAILHAATASVDGITWQYQISNGEAQIYSGGWSPAISSSTRGVITIPSSLDGYPVTSIGFYAFRGCSGLTSVTIPEGVTSIGTYAFDGCTGLTSVTIPEGVTSIGWSAFSRCSGLTSVTIPSSVTSIGSYAFSDCSRLTSVTISEGVTSIGDYAFSDCSGLSSVTIPSSVTSIGDYAFSSCSGLTSVTIPEGVTTIGHCAFSGCSGLTSVTIPSSVTSIGDYAFSGCSGLTSVTIPSCVTTIGDSAFSGCSSLTSVTIPSSVTSIGERVFAYCSSLTSVTILEGLTSIEDHMFDYCSNLTSVKIPESVTSIGSYAFYNCSGLTSVTIPEGVTSIGAWAFSGCSSLTSVTIPAGVTFIGGGMFHNCRSLSSVTIPEGVTSIGDDAFSSCSGLTSVTIPEGVTSIGDSAFSGCSGLTSFVVDSKNQYYSVIDGLLCSKDGKTLVACPGALTSVTIPSSVTSIGSYAFYNCSGLTSVTIPEGVTTIGERVFAYCSSLTSVTIPEGVTSIGERVFVYCSSLTSVTIPSSVTSIGNSAFSCCRSLTSVTIPSSVTSIGEWAFSWCSSLTSVIFEGSPPQKCDGFDVGPTGYYFAQYASEWEEVIAADGTWNGLTMHCMEAGKLFTLTFEANGGEGGQTLTQAYGTTFTAPNVTREGYAFAGWHPTVPSKIPAQDVTYTAQWQINQYTITFDATGGEGGTSVTQDYGSSLTAPTATREGYRFLGWSPEVPTTVPAANATYTAQWQINQYTITFDAAGGEGGTSVTQDYGSSLTAPTVTREYYTFNGWSPDVPATVPAGNKTYVAQWQSNQYTITFDAAGGEGGTVVTQDYATPLVVPSVTREYYTFLGWSPAVPTTVPAKDMVYTAQWKAYQYMQTFDANGGEGGVSLILDYGSTITPPTITREGYVLTGWKPELPEVVPPKSETYVAQWRREGEMDEPDPDEPTVHTPPSWSVSNYQNNMVVYAQVKDITTGAFIESAGSLLGAFDANGVCRGVIGLLDIGLEHPVYQLTVCSDETSGEVLTLKVWDAATGEITELSDKVNFVSDTEIGLLWEPVVYEIGLKALSMTLNPGWNWCSINVAMPEGTTLSEFFTDWTPQNGDQVKAGTQTATYFNGAWRPTDFVMQPGMMYLIKNGTDAAVTTTVMGTPAKVDETIDIATGWNWIGYTGAEPIAAANAFVDNSMFANGDVLKSNAASATFYNGAWRGVLTLTPGVGYKLKVASGATIQYAQSTATASLMAAPVAMMASTEAPDWKVSNYQYNMVVYASIQNAQGVSLEADGNLLAAFDANGVCRGVIDPLDIGIGVKVYQLTVCSDEATESGLTLKLWDAATSTIYDVNGTIDFKSDTEIGLLWEPQVYTVVETAVKFDVAANVIGDGTVTGAGAYEAGETVALTATPAEGYVFCGWSTTPVSMETTYSFTMPEEAMTLTAYFAPAAALNNYVAGQGFVSADEVDAKIQAYIAENNLKTPEEVEAAIKAHIASNDLLTPAQANQQTQDYIVANKLKSEQEVAVAIAQAIEEYVSFNGLLTPAEAEQLVKDYIADNKLMSKDEAKQELLDADEVFTADEMKALALGAPLIQVKNGKAIVSIQVQRASELDGEWEVVEDGEVSMEITPKADEKAGFYKFVVPNEQ